MAQPKVATIKQEGDKIAVAIPYDLACVDALKQTIPWQQREFRREFDNNRWLIDPAHLEAARQVITEHATANQWRVEDHTAKSSEEIAAEQADADAAALEQHVAAFLDILPQLPRQGLSLVHFDQRSSTMQLELCEHLGTELFRAVTAASLRHYQQTMRMPSDPKPGWGHQLVVSADERILRALIKREDVRHLKVYRDLQITASFDDGLVLHLEDAQGRAYIGGRWDTVALERWNHVRRSWPMAALDQGVYVIFEREQYLIDLLEEPKLLDGFSPFAVATPHRSFVAPAARLAHIEEWLKGWAQAALDAPPPALPSGIDSGRSPHNYKHPADLLLSHFEYVDGAEIARGADLATLLDWTGADILEHRARVEAWKQAAAAAKLADLRQRAPELARPLLAALTKEHLLELAMRHSLAARKSARKDELVSLLVACQAACEDVLKLSPVEQ